MKKILFLDVDGVLNSQQSMIARHDEWSKSSSKEDDVEFAWPLGHLDSTLVQRLNPICALTDCQIVISSSWRTICQLKDLGVWLEKRGFLYKDRILSKTIELINIENNTRGLEISDWLSKNLDISKYAILDDDSFDIIKVHPNNFVHTNCMEGLQNAQVEKVISILNSI